MLSVIVFRFFGGRTSNNDFLCKIYLKADREEWNDWSVIIKSIKLQENNQGRCS